MEEIKFNLFTTGNRNKNIFDGLNWNNGYAISGSVMTACIPEKTLISDLLCNEHTTYDDRWLTYFNHNYNIL